MLHREISGNDAIPVILYTSKSTGIPVAVGTIDSKETSQNLALGALSYTTNFAASVKVKAIYLHSSIAISQTITIKFNSKSGSNYDTTVDTETVSTASDYVNTDEILLRSGDEIDITCTNSGTPAATVYVTIMAEVIS